MFMITILHNYYIHVKYQETLGSLLWFCFMHAVQFILISKLDNLNT